MFAIPGGSKPPPPANVRAQQELLPTWLKGLRAAGAAAASMLENIPKSF